RDKPTGAHRVGSDSSVRPRRRERGSAWRVKVEDNYARLQFFARIVSVLSHPLEQQTVIKLSNQAIKSDADDGRRAGVPPSEGSINGG
ncbi:MAG TPA: hypothetical protein VNV38_05300, partial [Stellaceae bacterium]|nr:hypothetical protein [Stellaceae bacterium]